MTTDPSLMSATELLRLYRAKTLSPVEATRAALDRIAASDHALVVDGRDVVDSERGPKLDRGGHVVLLSDGLQPRGGRMRRGMMEWR